MWSAFCNSHHSLQWNGRSTDRDHFFLPIYSLYLSLDILENLWKTTTSFVRRVCPTVRPSVRPSVRLSDRPSVCPTVRPSVRPSVRLSSRKNSAPIERIFMKCKIRRFFENLSKNSSMTEFLEGINQFKWKSMYTYGNILLICSQIKKKLQTKFLEKFKIHLFYSINLLRNSVFYEIMCKKLVEPNRPQTATQYDTKSCDKHAG